MKKYLEWWYRLISGVFHGLLQNIWESSELKIVDIHFSYGTTTGEAGSMAKKIMAHNGQNFDAYYSVIMPDTWTPVFDLTNKNRVDKWLSDGKKQLKLVIGNIMSKRKGNFVDRKLYSRKPEL